MEERAAELSGVDVKLMNLAILTSDGESVTVWMPGQAPNSARYVQQLHAPRFLQIQHGQCEVSIVGSEVQGEHDGDPLAIGCESELCRRRGQGIEAESGTVRKGGLLERIVCLARNE